MKTKLILEIGCNHQGEIETAKDMIDKAAELGAWAVKFQKRDLDSIPADVAKGKRDLKNSFGKTYIDHRKKLEFSIDQIKRLKNYAENRGLIFICSAFDIKSAVELVENGIDQIKLPSQLYLNNELFKYLQPLQSSGKIQLYVSTGMHTENEILKSAWTRTDAIIFHCISEYPADPLNCNIRFMNKAGIFKGYSSHESEGLVIPFAIGAGAEYIERHFTLDKGLKGSDHKISSDPDETKNIINKIKSIDSFMGSGSRIMSSGEKAVKKIYRG